MGTRILTTDGYNNEEGAILFDAVTMWAFGPVFESGEMAEAFTQWVGDALVGNEKVSDMARHSPEEFKEHYHKFLDEWKYCGLSDEERVLYDEHDKQPPLGTSGLLRWKKEHAEPLQALKIKVEEAREERWNL